MLFKEAKEFLNSKGYVLEDFEIKKEYTGPSGSAVVTIDGKKFTANDFPKGTKDTNWKKLGSAIVSFNSQYPKWEKYEKMDADKLSNYMKDFLTLTNDLNSDLKRINYILKQANIDATVSDNVMEPYYSKRDEVIKYNKKLVKNETNAKLEERNGKVSDHILCFPNFEKAITFNVDWVNGTFHQWSGLCVFVDLSQIEGLTNNRNNSSNGYYDLTANNLNKIEQWLIENEDYIRKEMKHGGEYFDSVARDQARYYKEHPNGNWSGD